MKILESSSFFNHSISRGPRALMLKLKRWTGNEIARYCLTAGCGQCLSVC